MNKLKISSTMFLLVVFVLATNAQKKITREFTGIEKITLNTASGDCILKKSSNSEVSLTLEHDYEESEYEPVIEQEGSRLTIKEVFHGRSVSGKATWTLAIPDNIDVKFNTGSGDFSAENLKLDIDMNTGSGDLILSTIKGEVSANTGSGDIQIGRFEGDIRANTGSGSVEVNDGSGSLKINCGSGTIKLDQVNGMISANVGSGDIQAQGVTVTEASGFNSGSGNVEVELSATPTADISVNSGSGDAKVDFNGHALSGTLVMKANKRNGQISAPVKFDKEEEIKDGKETYLKKTAELGGEDIKIKIGTGSGTASLIK